MYEGFCCSESSESPKCVFSALEHLGAPESPKSHFYRRVRGFSLFWEPQMHFRRSWAVQSCSDRHEGQPSWRTEGRRTRIPGRAPLRRPREPLTAPPAAQGALANSYPVCGSASIPPPLQHVVVCSTHWGIIILKGIHLLLGMLYSRVLHRAA